MNELIEELKSERLKQGLSLQTISDQTHVSVSILQNLEEGDFRGLGTSLLTRSFLQSYCSVLRIDPLPFLEKYHLKMIACDIQEEGIKRYGVWSKPPQDVLRTRIIIMFSAGAILLGLLIGWACYYNWKSRMADSQVVNGNMYSQQDIPSDLSKRVAASEPVMGPEIHPENDDKTESLSSERQSESIDGGGSPLSGGTEGVMRPDSYEQGGNIEGIFHNVQPGSVNEQRDVHQFEIKTNDQMRVKLTIDGGTPKDILLKSGSNRTWDVKSSVLVEAKSKRGVSLTWDGRSVALSGAANRPLHLYLPN